MTETPKEEKPVEGQTTTEQILNRLNELKQRAAALKPLTNRKQRRAAETMARRLRKKKLKKRTV